MVEFSPDYLNLIIEDEKESINFYAQEIGFYSRMRSETENEIIKQYCTFFINYSETELENANTRLQDFRNKLTDC